jgi:LysR family glycine cleavage system transcriptional activator
VKRGQVPSIGELVCFVAAAKHGSFTRAADELNLTQGAVSRQIRLLENQLGIRLFERLRQRVVLTEAAKLYLGSVQKALDDLAAATRRVVNFSDARSAINLAILPTFATRWLIPRLPDFQAKNPTILVHLTTRQRPVDFEIEPFDAAISFGSPNWPGTIAHHLMDVDIVPVCSPALRRAYPIEQPADLLDVPLIHPLSRPTRWAEWLTAAGVGMAGSLPGPVYEQFSMISQAAATGMGVALLPRLSIEDELKTGRLEIIFEDRAPLKTSYFLIVPEARVSATAIRLFTDWLIAASQEYA